MLHVRNYLNSAIFSAVQAPRHRNLFLPGPSWAGAVLLAHTHTHTRARGDTQRHAFPCPSRPPWSGRQRQCVVLLSLFLLVFLSFPPHTPTQALLFFFYVIFMDSVVAVPSRVLLRVRLRATASDRPKRDVGCMTVIFFFFPFLSR